MELTTKAKRLQELIERGGFTRDEAEQILGCEALDIIAHGGTVERPGVEEVRFTKSAPFLGALFTAYKAPDAASSPLPVQQ